MTVIIPAAAKKARKKERVIRPARSPRAVRKEYDDLLKKQIEYLKAQTANLSDLVKDGATRQQVAATLAQMSASAQERMDQLAPQLAKQFVDRASEANRQAIEKSIASAFSVDFASIVDSPKVAGELDLAILENVNLIKSISQEHFEKVGLAVLDNYRGIDQVGGVSLQQRLKDLGGITDSRAAFIARDQTSKLTGNLNQIRQEDNGIDEYIWKNSQDNRVVGNPSGKYPKGNKAHGNHWDREGKTYRWDDPPPDGHPGVPINCRCYAAPKLDLDKLKAQFI